MNHSVPPSALATQPIGEPSRIAEGLYQLKLPVPFPLMFVAAYLLQDPHGWTIVDPGFDYSEARQVWEKQARQLDLDLDRDVSRIIVTHLHPNHIGLARWLQQRSGAPVYMLEGAIEDACKVWNPARNNEPFVEFLIRNGMDEPTARRTAGATSPGLRVPESLIPLHDGQTMEFGERRWRVIHTPGHSDFRFILHEEEGGCSSPGTICFCTSPRT